MATEQQQKKKKSQKKSKTVREVIPQRGFEYRVGQPIFADTDDAYAFKMALYKVTSSLDRDVVDDLLANLMKKAKEVQQPGDGLYTIAFEKAREQTPWTAELKEGIISELLLFLKASRERHIKFTHYRQTTLDPKSESKLAKAIDDFTGDSPAAEPDEDWVETDKLDPAIIDKMMYRMRHGLGADWGSSSDSDEDEDLKKKEAAKKKAEESDKELAGLLAGMKLDK